MMKILSEAIVLSWLVKFSRKTYVKPKQVSWGKDQLAKSGATMLNNIVDNIERCWWQN